VTVRGRGGLVSGQDRESIRNHAAFIWSVADLLRACSELFWASHPRGPPRPRHGRRRTGRRGGPRRAATALRPPRWAHP
jgi:hypothetical protein